MIRTACPSNWLFQYQSKFLSQKHPSDPEEWVFQFIMHTAMIPKAHSLRFELLWFLQLLGFCGSFLWLVGQDCGRDCSGHGKHLGQGGREGGCGHFFSVYCVNHPFFLLYCLSVLMWFWPLTFAPIALILHAFVKLIEPIESNIPDRQERFSSPLCQNMWSWIMDHGSWLQPLPAIRWVVGDGCVSCTRLLFTSSGPPCGGQRLQIMVWGVVTEGLCPNILRIRGIHILQSVGCKFCIFSVYQLRCSLFSSCCNHTAAATLHIT